MEAQDKAADKSLLRRLFSTETAICCVGIGCMIYGVVNGLKVMPLFFGLCIVGGSVMLHFVRKKDWDAHWSDMDRIRREHEQRMADEQQSKEKKG
jgi:flagellar biosynthesis component FlhA